MDLLTPIRLAKCLHSADARREYARTLRRKYWAVSGSDKLLRCKLENGLRMLVHTADQSGVSRSVFVNGSFEPDELAFIRRTVKPGMTVFDVGANIGVHSLILADCVGETGKAHAFEPSAVFDRLSHNVQLNGFQSRFELNRCALGEKEGKLALSLCPTGFEAYTSVGSPLRAQSRGKTFEVEATTLDRYCSARGISTIDFMKVDVEGFEVAVFRGGRSLLKGKGIRIIMFEVNDVCLKSCGFSGEGLFELFHSAGYATFELQRGTQKLIPSQSPPRGTWNTVIARVG